MTDEHATTGNISATMIKGELERLRPDVATAAPIANEHDANHWDFFVTLQDPVACFYVQAKTLGTSNLKLPIKHLRDWIHAPLPTVLMWWDEGTRKAYWADILRFLLRRGGTAGCKDATFNRDKDLRHLETRNSQSRRRFLKWIRDLCRLWPDFGMRNMPEWQLDLDFPVGFVDVIEEPDILMYLPVSHRLTKVIDDYADGRMANRAQLPARVLKVARQFIGTPKIAAASLVQQCGLPGQDRELMACLEQCFSDWHKRIPPNAKAAMAKTLWAFDKLLSMANYRGQGDLRLPTFASRHTYPIGNLVRLLPSNLLSGPLSRILETDNDWRVLLYAAWCFGILNHNVASEPWREIRRRRLDLRSRTDKIGSMWRVVDRQLLYTEAQLGSNQALTEFVDRLADQDAAQFEAAYNFLYYSKDLETIRYRYEQRLEEGFRTDANTLQIIKLHYQILTKRLREDKRSLLSLTPILWPVK